MKTNLNIEPIGSNQTVLHVGDVAVLFSYSTPVAAFVPGRGYIKSEQKYSATTSKHVNAWSDYRETVPQSEIDNLLTVNS